jgi:hypothetical protein
MTDHAADRVAEQTLSNRAEAPGATESSRPPNYDPAAVGRVARGVSIRSIDLVGASFTRADHDALPVDREAHASPELGIDVQSQLSDDGSQLGCLLTFATIFSEVEPYQLTAQFRLTYDVRFVERPQDADVDQFANWNAVFNAWPYWREYLSSTLNRARLDYFLVPVMAVPLPSFAPTEPGQRAGEHTT